MQLPSEIRMALERIDFVNRYVNLSAKYRFESQDRMGQFDDQTMLCLFSELGYSARYEPREDFFQIAEENPPFRFEFNISVKNALVEFVWVVVKDGELQIGDPWCMLKRLWDGTDENGKPAGFRDYNELKEILAEAFQMYEEFKRELLLSQ